MDEAQIDREKMALSLRVKESLRRDFRAMSWDDKVASIARMNVAGKIARQAMQEALAKKAQNPDMA